MKTRNAIKAKADHNNFQIMSLINFPEPRMNFKLQHIFLEYFIHKFVAKSNSSSLFTIRFVYKTESSKPQIKDQCLKLSVFFVRGQFPRCSLSGNLLNNEKRKPGHIYQILRKTNTVYRRLGLK